MAREIGGDRVKFEYKRVVVPGGFRMTEEALNELGAQGWELVHVDPTSREWFFKKQARTTRTKKAE
ncbi:DUF4177 domain-containing protein [Streptomyces lasalocidi]|uniref:DUF4177 domain-containing protein n=1 Tax=Streptomyces lasalocidi TaxID=324833 RepID=A0A4V6AWC9_STRLS|nr:DUF4177 domain-containing protein [Streptomyces lasalocidi]